MLASDIARGVLGAAFVLTVDYQPLWPLYLLSGLLMFASPFFTSGRTAILPTIASKEEQAGHEAQLDAIAASSGGKVLWRELAETR